MHWVIVLYLNRSMVVDSLPKLHNLLTIVAQRENVPGLRVAIFHLVHRFISAFVKVFSLIYRFTIRDAATPLSLGRPWQPSQDCVLVQTVPHCSKGSASSPSVEPVTQNVRTTVIWFSPPQDPWSFLPSIPPAMCRQSFGLPSCRRELAPPWPSIKNRLKPQD